MTRFKFMSARSIPISRVTPGPKRMLEVAISKAVSCVITSSFRTVRTYGEQSPVATTLSRENQIHRSLD
jgi:hypothetical protein